MGFGVLLPPYGLPLWPIESIGIHWDIGFIFHPRINLRGIQTK